MEDEAIIALDEARRLERFGYEVVVAHAGEKAVARALADPPVDLVLMDIDLGAGMDGREAAREILRHRSIPIVFLTSHAEEDVVARVRDITRYGYVLKNAGDFVLKSSLDMAFELFQAHERLEQSEARYRGLFEQAPIAIWEEDFSAVKERLDELEGGKIGDVRSYLRERPELVDELIAAIRILDVNETSLRMYGAASKAELMSGVANRFPGEAAAQMLEEFVALREGRSSLSLEQLHVTREGAHMPVQVDWFVPPEHRVRYDRVVVSITDISELRRSEANLSVTLDSIADGVIVTDPAGGVVRMNPAAEALAGWSREQARGRGLDECFPIVDSRTRQSVANPVRRVLETGETVELGNHTALLRPDGTERQIADAASPIREGEGPILGAVLVFRDVTERYARREALRRRERQLARAQEISGVGSWEFDLDTGTASGSVQAHRIYGLAPGTLTIETAQSVPLPQYRDLLNRALRDLIERGRPYDLEFRIRRVSDGAIRTVHSVAESHAERRVVTGMIRDVTDERAVRAELRKSEEWFRTVVENANDIVYTVDDRGRFTYVSPAWKAMLGQDPAEVIGRSFEDFVHPEDRQICRSFYERVLESGEPQAGAAYRVFHKDGSLRVHASNAAPIHGGAAGTVRCLGIARDITATREAEDRIQELLAEKDLLLREVHHRVKNNLTTVAALLSLQAGNVESQEARGALMDAQGRVRAMLSIYQTLFQSENYREVSLRDFLRQLVVAAQETQGGGVGAPTVGIETDLQEIIMPASLSVPLGIAVNELVANAFKYAFPEGKASGGEAPLLRVTAELTGETVTVQVADNGIGLPDWVQLGGVGADGAPAGTGFGLQLVQAEALQLGGELELRRERGTSVTLRFPHSQR